MSLPTEKDWHWTNFDETEIAQEYPKPVLIEYLGVLPAQDALDLTYSHDQVVIPTVAEVETVLRLFSPDLDDGAYCPAL